LPSGNKKISKNQAPSKTKTKVNVDINLPLNRTTKIIIGIGLFLLSAGLAWYYIYWSFIVNKEYCFPLDDPWIHLNFARNLIEFGSYSYFKNEIVTAGSTSPIYTLILALGYVFIKNEFLLSFSLGILFFSLTAITIYKLFGSLFKENWVGIAAVLIFAMDRWMNYFADSGMETTCYIFLLILAYYFYIKRKPVLFGLILGLTIWARPDAIAFMAAIAIDYLVLFLISRKTSKENVSPPLFTRSQVIRFAAAFGIILLAYFVMNMALSGSLLPNTYSAKTVYYTPELRSRTDFLKFEVWGYFTSSSYTMLIVPFIIGVILIIHGLLKRRYNNVLAALLFILFLVFLYWYKLPFAAVKGRYLVPIIPFYIIVSVYGAGELFRTIAVFLNERKVMNFLCIAFFAITIIYTASAYIAHKNDYAEQTHRIAIRNVAAAKWLDKNTPENSIIATHDIGAIGYYTRRKIVDVAGLISPQFTPKLFDPDFASFMTDEMTKQNVSYIAFMKEWYQVSNQYPLFEAGDNNSEVISIYKFDNKKTHVVSREASGALQMIIQYISSKQVPQAQQLANRLVSKDPRLAPAFYYLSYTYSVSGNFPDAEKYLIKALEIFPQYHEALNALVETYKLEHKPEDAKNYLRNYLVSYPADSNAIKLLASIQDTTGTHK